jgi:hypothetical protein
MSGRMSISFVDFAAVLFDFDRVCYVSITSFLVRNWCGLVAGLWIGCIYLARPSSWSGTLDRLRWQRTNPQLQRRLLLAH